MALVKEEVGPSGEVDGNRKKMVCFNCFKLCCSAHVVVLCYLLFFFTMNETTQKIKKNAYFY